MTDVVRRRPALVTVVAVLVGIAGVVVVADGIALVVGRNNELVQIPLRLARVDESLPFDNGQDLSVYVAAIGAVVALAGVVLGLLGLGIARGRVVAYVVALVLLVSLTAGALVVRGRATDDLARLGLAGIGAAMAVLVVLLLLLLAGRRSRAWVLGRSAEV
jgi:hypothetical protein